MHITFDRRRIYYDLIGAESGPVVCFTHSLASDGGMWAEQMASLLAGGYRVLRVDMRGHGGSDPVAGDYTMSALAADTAGVLGALGLEQVHFIGLSIGGMIGQAFAIEHGAKLKSLMLCDTLPGTLPGAKELWAPRVNAVKSAGSLTPLADATTERWLTPAFKARNPARWRQIRETVAATTPAGFLGSAAAILNFDFVPKLPSLKIATLVVCGTDDEGTPPKENERIASLVPGARYEAIGGARHFPNVELPDLFNRIMMGWLDARR
jgi:3-oxoadipate enol-lactonase